MTGTVVYQCIQDYCPNAWQIWEVPVREVLPGLLDQPRLVCAGCSCEPIRRVLVRGTEPQLLGN